MNRQIRSLCLTGGVVLLAGTCLSVRAGTAAAQSANPKTFDERVAPIIKKYCWDCHSGDIAPAGIVLEGITTQKQMVAQPEMWDRVVRALESHAMPPKSSKQPSEKERAQAIEGIQTVLSSECSLADPGKVTLRRLNRTEYDNTIRDLTGIDFNFSEDFPSDDVGYGFDNIGDTLSLSPLLLEKYMAAAESIANQCLFVPQTIERRFGPEEMVATGGANVSGDGAVFTLYSNGSAEVRVRVETAGEYELSAVAFATQAGNEPAKMRFRVDGRTVDTMDVNATRSKPLRYATPVQLSKGEHRFAIEFFNDFYQPEHPDPNRRDRNLFLESMEVKGPQGEVTTVPASHRKLFPYPLDDSGLRPAISNLATRIYRRPAKPAEVDRLVKLVLSVEKSGEPIERGLQLALQAMLCSPHFLYHVELDDQPNTDLDSFAIASRLSYFLWSSMPDDELMKLAALNELRKPEVLSKQVQRMLADARAAEFAHNFCGQWLQTRKLDAVTPDPEAFPEFDDALRNSMKRETEQYFLYIVRNNRPVTEFISSDYTYLDARLAKHYNLPAPPGGNLQFVKLPSGKKGGILAQGSMMTVTSNPSRTSPVKRGKYILENLLGAPPPPPPPGVASLLEDGKAIEGKTLRERLEQHRADPACATCHTRMDGFGLALENFDGVGRWRTVESGRPVDPTAMMPSGEKIDGPDELRQYLLTRKNSFVRCLAEKLLTYATGRGMRTADRCHLDSIVEKVSAKKLGMTSLVEAVVTSDPFLKRGKEK